MPAETVSAGLETLRTTEFAALGDSAYLNAAAVAPLPERSRAAIEAHNAVRSRAQDLRDEHFYGPMRRCREAAARLIGADASEIALGGNTSFGINLAAFGLPLERGARVVASEGEFPANVYPWMAQRARGVELELVPADPRGLPDEERMLERLDRGDVAVLALSSVQFGSGYRADVARFGAACRERGVIFVVDAIQSVGHLPMDVEAMRIDVLATGGHKWLCGPFGTGFAYVRRALHEVLEPPAVGWTSMEACRDFANLTRYHWGWVDGARRYEVATPPFQDLLGLATSMEMLADCGVETIERHLLDLLEPLVDWLRDQPAVQVVSDLDPRHRSGIVAFRTPQPEADFAALTAAGVVCVQREGAIRIAPHLYNTAADIDRVLAVLSDREWSR
jgi:cysteine desulfurase / selenocysteine lyase